MPDELIIEAGRGERQYWRDLWAYRELFYFLAWRDILVRYKQTVIGIAWALVRPLLTMLVFTFVFSRLAKLRSRRSAPYSVMVFAAMLPWQFFSTSLTESSNSLIGNSNLISKIYFPRLIVPAGSVITSFVDFLISGVLMVALMLWYHWVPDWRVLCLPLFVVLAFAAAMGPGLWRRPQRQVSGFPLHCSVHCANRPLRFACRLQQPHCAGEVAVALFVEPDGRSN